jgi:molybdenum cofactor biosynthesis enzyme MoaA
MPFNGDGLKPDYFMSYKHIIETIRAKYPDLEKTQDAPNSTSSNYKIPGFKGDVGVIAAFSRTFCGTCNRLRVTPTGDIKTCLYADNAFNIRDLMRSNFSDEYIINQLQNAILKKPKDGFQAEKERKSVIQESMTTIGG